MKSKIPNIALFGICFSAAASAEMDAASMKIMSSEIKQVVGQGDYLALHETIEERC